jgi:hypothetical protein
MDGIVEEKGSVLIEVNSFDNYREITNEQENKD